MDKLAQAAVTWNLDVLKEPRGFIKLLQFVLAIFAFATTTSVSTSSSFTRDCNGTDASRTIDISYPFRLSQSDIQLPLCPGSAEKVTSPCCDYASFAEFYVFVGVMAFLYCIGAVVLYVCFDDKYYRRHPFVRSGDFVISCVFVALWLVASSAWADGLRQMKIYSDPAELFSDARVVECFKDIKNCHVTNQGNFASLNVSVMFGFLNLVVWAGNLWFLFKETHWFKEPELNLTGAHPSPSTPSTDRI